MVAGGGAVGACMRYLTAIGFANFGRHTLLAGQPSFLIATLCVNLVGCLAIGILGGAGWLTSNQPQRLWLAVGFLGSLTTFSAFGYESWQLIEQNRWVWLLGNILANLLGGLACVGLGIGLARILMAPAG